jgi:hypothetical protein
MLEPKVYDFSKHIADLCATRGKDVFKLAAKLSMDPIELLQMINGTPERATEWIATYIKEKKHTPGKRLLAKQYREEFFTEYSTGEMTPEKKALITSILGFKFFAPVDRFESECQQVAEYLAWKAQQEG